MALDVEAALVGLHALMDTIPDLQLVRIGAPESLSAQVEGWVTLGDLEQEVSRRSAGGPYEMLVNLICWFGYDVEGAEEAAERELAQFMAEITRRLVQNRIRAVDGVAINLNGSVTEMGLPRPASVPSEYPRIAGRETRLQTIGLLVALRENIN